MKKKVLSMPIAIVILALFFWPAFASDQLSPDWRTVDVVTLDVQNDVQVVVDCVTVHSDSTVLLNIIEIVDDDTNACNSRQHRPRGDGSSLTVASAVNNAFVYTKTSAEYSNRLRGDGLSLIVADAGNVVALAETAATYAHAEHG